MHGCTIVARNYLAHARVAAESFLRHHPGGTFSVLLLDDHEHPIARSEPFRTIRPFEIGLDPDEVRRMAMIYGVTEFATAVKPWLLRTLLESGLDSVAYFDPDIEFFAPIDDVFDQAREHSIVLIPHMMEPLSRKITEPVETMVMLAGAYNLGFIALGAGADEFLDWWCERLSRECLIAPERARFVDQRWVDLVPGLFSPLILRDPSCDVAYWNLQQRSFEWDGQRYLVEGRPLRFFHFSGFDPETPHVLSKFQGPKPAVLLSDRPHLQRVCLEYADHLMANGFDEVSAFPYGFDALPGGTPVNHRIRRLYREALERAEDDDAHEPEPPVPLDPQTAGEFIAWLNAPSYHPVGDVLTVSRYLESLWAERPDLRAAFPNVRWTDTARFLDWVVTKGRYEDSTPFELVPVLRGGAEEIVRNGGPPLSPGVNIAGYFKTESGVGEHGRRILDGLRSAGIPCSTVLYRAVLSRHDHAFDENDVGAPYDVNLVCVNADQLLTFRHDVGPHLFEGRYTIGFWAWELAEFPEFLHPAFTSVDEIWVGSDFVRDAIAADTSKPVLTIPLPVAAPSLPASDVVSPFAPAGDFSFLFVFDFLSVFERKNPLGLVDAFTRAFGPGEGPSLLIKSINGDKHLLQLERLRAACAHRPDIQILDGYVALEQRAALLSSAGCYVSLHRAEGFGFTMAEAMSFGIPTIATGYSGNLAFMNEQNSYLVPYALAAIPDTCPPYPAGVEWAEPDVDAAASLMRYVYENPDEARARGERAARDIAERHSAARLGAFAAARLDEIRSARDSVDPARAA